MGLFDQATSQPNQGLMGLGQPQGNQPQMTFLPPQETSNPFATGGGLPMPQNPNYMGQPQGNMPQESYGVPSLFMNQGAMQGAMFRQEPTDPNYVQRNYTAQDVQTAMKNPEFDSNYYKNANVLDDQGNPMSMDAKQQLIQPFYNQVEQSMQYSRQPTGMNSQGFPIGDSVGRPMQQPQQPQRTNQVPNMPQSIPRPEFFSGPNAGKVPMGFSMVNGEMVKTGNFNEQQPQETIPALRPTPQPPQIFQPMQQQNPVNTQTVQPNFMGQTPFGQAQTGQFTSTNPFVQAAQANAQGNIAGALQATAANRINQQTPYGSLSYQQTGTDAQGNPIWSANQNLSPELQQLTQSSLAGLQASQANPMYGINPGDTYSNAIMQRLAPQQSQAREALDAQLANQGIMPGSEAYNRAKTLLGQTQNDALTSAIVGGMQTGLQAQGLQNTTAANIRNLATPGYVTPYNQAAVAGPDYLSAYTSQNATDIARQNAEAAQRSSLLSTLGGLGSSAILGGTGANSALGGLLGLGNQGLTALGNSSLWSQLFGGTTAKAPLTDFSPGTSVLNVSPEYDPQAYGLL